MALNRVFAQNNKTMTLPVASGKLSGDSIAVGQIPGVLLTDRDADGYATVQMDGVFTLPVEAVSTNVVPGTILYWDAVAPFLSNVNTGVRFGYSLGNVTAAATTSIRVQVGY